MSIFLWLKLIISRYRTRMRRIQLRNDEYMGLAVGTTVILAILAAGLPNGRWMRNRALILALIFLLVQNSRCISLFRISSWRSWQGRKAKPNGRVRRAKQRAAILTQEKYNIYC